MAQKRGGSGGLKNALSTGLVFLVLASSIIGWAKVNDINSVTGGYNYFKSWSDKLWACGAGEAKYECGGDGSSPANPTPAPVDPTNPVDPAKPGTPSNPGETKPGSSGIPVVEKNEAMQILDTLTVTAAVDTDYVRKEWKHWTGSPCDARENALKVQGKDVVSDPKSCKATAGTWTDPYSKDVFTDAGEMDIDHVIPLSYASQHGGQAWTPEKKEQFANDPSQLLVSSAKENRSKSDKGPEEYMPPNRDFHCDYSKMWVSTASNYGISITEGDKRALKTGLQKC